MVKAFRGSILLTSHKHRGDSSAPRSGLSLLHKLMLEHVQVNAFLKMKVRLAAQVRSSCMDVCLAVY